MESLKCATKVAPLSHIELHQIKSVTPKGPEIINYTLRYGKAFYGFHTAVCTKRIGWAAENNNNNKNNNSCNSNNKRNENS